MAVHHGASGEPLSVELDPKDFGALLREVRGFDRALATATRKRLRDAAKPAVKDVQQRILSGPARRDVGLRRGLAAGTKVSIRTGKRGAGVSITTTGAKLPDGKQPMVRAYNKPSFRHPVFGDRDVWVTQSGRPYFGYVLDKQRERMREAVEAALADAVRTVRTGTVTGS